MKKIFFTIFYFSFVFSFSQDYLKMNKKELRVEHQKKLNIIDSLFSVNTNLKDINTNLTYDLSVSEKTNLERISTINSLETIIDELNLEIENVKDERTRLSDVNLGLNEMIVALSDSIMSVTNQLNYQLGIYRDQNIQQLDIEDWRNGILSTGGCYNIEEDYWRFFFSNGKYYFSWNDISDYEIVSMEYDNYMNNIILTFGDKVYEPDYVTDISEEERIMKIKVIGDTYYFLDNELEIKSVGHSICF